MPFHYVQNNGLLKRPKYSFRLVPSFVMNWGLILLQHPNCCTCLPLCTIFFLQKGLPTTKKIPNGIKTIHKPQITDINNIIIRVNNGGN